MKTTTPIFIAALGSITVLISIALAHPGGLDSKGGHFNRKTGEYHYHRTPAEPAAPSSVVPVQRLQPPAVDRTEGTPQDSELERLRKELEECRKENARLRSQSAATSDPNKPRVSFGSPEKN